MNHIIFKENEKYKIALLIKDSAMNQRYLEKHYINNSCLDAKDFIAFSLKYNDKNKAPAAPSKAYLGTLLKALKRIGTEALFVCDSTYFKYLTGVRKVDSSYGYIKKCSIKGYEDMDVVLSVNYQRLFYNPDLKETIGLSVNTLDNHINGTHIDIGSDIIHSAQYPKTIPEIENFLNNLHQYPELTCDIEAFGLKHYETGIGTIGFAWDEHNGGAFAVDYKAVPPSANGVHGLNIHNKKVNKLLLDFFNKYEGKLTYHNGNYDIKIMINALFMNNLLDQKGMIEGIKKLSHNIDDTKLITYLATNSTAGNKLGLKYQAHEFAGDYAEDVQDITKVPLDDLLKYNLIDCLSTWFVKKKHLPTMLQDNQNDIYQNIFIPSMRPILQMELTGVPIDMEQVYKAELELLEIQAYALDSIIDNPFIVEAQNKLEQAFLDKDFASRKAKAKHPENIKPKLIENINIPFNVGSNNQLRVLLYEVLGLPVIDLTKDSKEPATGAKTLKKLINHTLDNAVSELLSYIIEYSQATKITSTFIKAFKENSVLKDDGVYYLHGNYNLGATVSGRLSSSQPNLQNLPSGSTYAKLIKKCFIAPENWLLCGADFDSLEDKISALTTKDENKLKVYTDGYCGHCLRAYSYFKENMSDVRNLDSEVKVYKAKVGDSYICFIATDTINYKGKKYSGQEFYERSRHNRL